MPTIPGVYSKSIHQNRTSESSTAKIQQEVCDGDSGKIDVIEVGEQIDSHHGSDPNSDHQSNNLMKSSVNALDYDGSRQINQNRSSRSFLENQLISLQQSDAIDFVEDEQALVRN